MFATSCHLVSFLCFHFYAISSLHPTASFFTTDHLLIDSSLLLWPASFQAFYSRSNFYVVSSTLSLSTFHFVLRFLWCHLRFDLHVEFSSNLITTFYILYFKHAIVCSVLYHLSWPERIRSSDHTFLCDQWSLTDECLTVRWFPFLFLWNIVPLTIIPFGRHIATPMVIHVFVVTITFLLYNFLFAVVINHL